jgi:hypothetical protein
LSSNPENLQILANEISNSALFRSGDFIKKSLKIPKGHSEEEQTTQWQKVQKNKQRSSNHYN